MEGGASYVRRFDPFMCRYLVPTGNNKSYDRPCHVFKLEEVWMGGSADIALPKRVNALGLVHLLPTYCPSPKSSAFSLRQYVSVLALLLDAKLWRSNIWLS